MAYTGALILHRKLVCQNRVVSVPVSIPAQFSSAVVAAHAISDQRCASYRLLIIDTFRLHFTLQFCFWLLNESDYTSILLECHVEVWPDSQCWPDIISLCHLMLDDFIWAKRPATSKRGDGERQLWCGPLGCHDMWWGVWHDTLISYMIIDGMGPPSKSDYVTERHETRMKRHHDMIQFGAILVAEYVSHRRDIIHYWLQRTTFSRWNWVLSGYTDLGVFSHVAHVRLWSWAGD